MMQSSLVALCLALASVVSCAAPARTGDSPVVSTAAGRIRGLSRPGGGAQFLGIPYAEPPVGSLRWRAPVPAKPWVGTRNATTFGSPCAQTVLGDWNRRDAGVSREDCLYLNVTVPAWPVRKALPVMFWIHGGANQGGSGGGDLYNDGTLVSHGVVLVTINYRLGIFGFFAHPALARESAHDSAGNYALMDQILALQWVRANIARFGGDPHNITVFGQSAGATDIGLLMASRAKDLFQKAIEESGAPVILPPLPSLAQAQHTGVLLAAALAAPSGDAAAIAYLRGIPAPKLLSRLDDIHASRRFDVSPDVDGWVLDRQPRDSFAAGEESAIPLIFGTTTRELNFSLPIKQLRTMLDQRAGSLAPQFVALYGLAPGDRRVEDAKYGGAGSQFIADVGFRCPAVLEGIWHTAAGQVAYEYEFDHTIPGQPLVLHSYELPYVFGFFPTSGNLTGHFTAEDYKLADLIETYWTNFAKTGSPNSGGLPEWLPFGRSRSYIEFLQGGGVAQARRLRRAQCALFRKLVAQKAGASKG